MKIGYLVGRYPAASHAFLLREVAALRERGIELETISIRPPHRDELLTPADREAAASTYRVLPPAPLKLAGAHLWALARAPLRYLRTLRFALGLGPPGARARLWRLFYFAEAIIVARRCARRGITHLHTHFADTATDSALLATRYLIDVGYSITVHGPLEFAEDGLNRLSEKVRRARRVVAVSEHGAARLRRYLAPEEAGKVEVVRLGIEAWELSAGEGSGVGGALRVLCIGRLVPQKAQAVLVDAIAALAREGEPCALTLAGDGPERQALERRVETAGIAEAVTFTGVVGQDRVRELLAAADVLCLPSLAEGLPAVLLEAMACAVPVISTPVGGIPELIDNGENGLLVRPGSARELARALATLAADPGERRRLGQAGTRTVAERHSVEAHADGLARALRAAGQPGAA